MRLQPYFFVRRLIKATGFWQENYLILRELRHFPWTIVCALGFTLAAAAFEGLGLGFLLAFLQSLVSPGAEPFQTGIRWFDVWILGINEPDLNRLYRVSALILVTTWMRAGFRYLGYVYMEMLKLRVVDRIKQQIFEQLQAFSLGFFSKTRSGELINTLTTEASRLREVFRVSSFIIAQGSMILVYVLVMIRISWQLSLISVMLFSLLAVWIARFRARVREASFPISKANGRFTSVAQEFINGIRTVHAFSTQDFERQRFYRASEDVVTASTRSALLFTAIRPITEGLATTILVGMIVLGIAVFVANGTLEIASLLTFLFVVFRLVPSAYAISGDLAQISNFAGSIENVKALLQTHDKPYLQNGQVQFSQLQRAIEFVSVDFGYDPDDLVLHNITLTIPRGRTIALVGSSGAGKTTLADLIPRFYDPTQGQILIDGTDLRQFDIHSVRRKMAIVSQDTFIFNTSVRENIAYGSDAAAVTDDAIVEAARLANALEFILEMPEGFETQLGDRGVRLSGGQRQRIAIARALLRNPEILILDEATSALDSVSERLIQESLDKLAVGRTVIAIAHRLSTIMRSDKVVVLEQGRVVEQGTYTELLEQRGRLWNYHQMQHEYGQTR